ncbi:MAG: 1-acyl-sn-glycerol-3-phosphate acyltransferase [Saprospiraceae bacterium]
MAYRNAHIHPVLRLIYALLRIISWAGIYVFYRRRLVLGRENLRFDGPAIVVSNHPSTLMDPLNVGINIRQVMFFLANYSLFKNPLGSWLLSRLYCIPVKRKEDVSEGEARDNDAAFEKSFQHLEKNGVLFIAAEGVSWMNRFVRPFKTGAARIAFGSERRNQWQLGVKIIPVGVTYDAPRLFRSRTTVEYGQAIDPSPWAVAEEQDHENAVNDFTAELRNRVQALTFNSGGEAGDSFVNQTETLFRNAQLGFSETEKHLVLKRFFSKNLQNEGLRSKIAGYFKSLDKAGISDIGLSKPKGTIILPVLLLPFFLLGYSFWFLPCWLPWLLCKRMNLYPGYDSNIKVLSGLFVFPLALWGGWELAYWVLGSKVEAWASLALLVICGYLAELFMDHVAQWQAWRVAQAFKRQDPYEWDLLIQARTEILKEVVSA